ncbi:hypothetical protein [Streptomyces sp. MB09-02B]|uniref:hypothetical protein n=1 Tax=Streptomyces sp. MB09-02B TaxID=3028667 RepID=UPI0029A68877|nr:hypothetical protein [Streptomyces sp. MB09-02B]MDX3642492.1 hypothetical protein [Streptomyces sp. MB09-02B]
MKARTMIAVAVPVLLGAAVAAGSFAVAGMNVQKNTADPAGGGYAKVQDGPGLSGDLVSSHIETWYHPLPWIGAEIGGVTCPDLAAVRDTKITCTGTSGGAEITVPVSVVKVGAGAAPRVTWKFER